MVVGGGQEKDPLRGYVIRAFSHRAMADVCRGFAQKYPGEKIRKALGGRGIPDDLADMADTFCSLRDERNEADYNFVCGYTKEDATIIISQAEVAHRKWQGIRGDRVTKVFLVALLVHQNVKTSR